jgi:hypothetical protein
VIGIEFQRGRPFAGGWTYWLSRDGWFRKKEGQAKGYGLMIRSVSTGTKPVEITPHFKVYRATMSYLPTETPMDTDRDDVGVWEKDKFYVIVHNNYTIQEVKKYIENNMSKWQA